MLQGYLDSLLRVDLAFLQPLAEVLRSQIHIDDLVCFGDDRVGQTLPHLHSHRLFNGVIETLDVLKVQGGDDVNPRCKDLLDILVSFHVPAARNVCMGQLIDQHHLRLAGKNCIYIHLFHGDPPVLLTLPGNDLQPFDEFFRFDAAVGHHESDHYIDSLLLDPVPFQEHLKGLSDTGRVTEVDLQPASLGPADHSEKGIGSVIERHRLHPAVEIEIEHQHVDAGFSEDSQIAALCS